MPKGKVHVYPKLRAEPDLDQIVLALLCMLDERAGAKWDATSPAAEAPPERKAS